MADELAAAVGFEVGPRRLGAFALRTAGCMTDKAPSGTYRTNCNLIDAAAPTEPLERFGYRWRLRPTPTTASRR